MICDESAANQLLLGECWNQTARYICFEEFFCETLDNFVGKTKFRGSGSAYFAGKTTNSAAWLEISQAMKDSGPQL